MPMEFTKKSLKINKLIQEKNLEYVYENDLIVPDTKPDVNSILQVDCDAIITDKQVKKGVILLYCKVNYKVIYLSEETNSIKSIISENEFQYSIDIESSDTIVSPLVYVDLTKIEFEVMNGRKIRLKSSININCKIYKTEIIDIVSDVIDKTNSTQIRKNTIKISNTCIQDSLNFTVKDSLEVPFGKSSINDFLKADMRIESVETKLLNNKILVKGDINATFLYVGNFNENGLEYFETSIPFSEVIEVDNINEELECECECKISNSYYDLKEDLDGDIRLLDIENTIQFDFNINEEIEFELIEDIFDTNNDINITKNNFNFDTIVKADKVELSDSKAYTIPEELPAISEVYNVINKPYITSTIFKNGMLAVEGVIDTYFLYISDSKTNPIYSYKVEFPFNTEIDTNVDDEGIDFEIKIDLEHFDYNLNKNNDIFINYLININYKIIKVIDIEMIEGAELVAFEENKDYPSITIYFVQKGDTLWDISKKYKISIDDLKIINDIEDNVLEPGRQILIQR
jgi:hypothetical protein